MGFNNNERRPKASSDAENYAKGNLKTSTEVWSHAEAKGGGGKPEGSFTVNLIDEISKY